MSVAERQRAPQRVLIVDDDVELAQSLARMIEAAGTYETRMVHSAADALAVAVEFPPVIVFLDIELPDMSGYEVAERIRHEAWGKSVILIALTGWGQESDRRHALASGFNHHLIKPVDPDALEELFSA